MPKLRVPARAVDWFAGSDAGIAILSDRVPDTDPDRAAAYKAIFDAPERADGSRWVELTADQLDALHESAEWFANAVSDTTWHPDGRADLNAARALLRRIDRLLSTHDE